MRHGQEFAVLLTLGGGVMFTFASISAWVTARRAGGVVLAVLAGANFAFAIVLLNR